MSAPIPFDNSYARLPQRFHAPMAPVPVSAPRVVALNRALALQLGLDPDWLAGPDGVAMLAGNRYPEGAAPLAMAYAGHQFGNFVPQLGDGRATLVGELVAPGLGRRDIHLKGSGRTAYSGRGDGRAALGPMLREYIVSEAMAALGIPSTRALAVTATGEAVYRETPLPGAVLARVASSHIRVGTFQYFIARGDMEALRLLADHAIARHDPRALRDPKPYRAFLDGVVARQADLVARWLLVGFIHGVMNTDNMSIAGETIDYGPCAFMDAYDPATVFSSIDRQGRYAYANQPQIALWNLARLAECLLPLLDADEETAVAEAETVLQTFADRFNAAYIGGMRRKLGLLEAREDDLALAQDLLARMTANGADFTLTFRRLSDAVADPAADGQVAALFQDGGAFAPWAERWRARLAQEAGDVATRQAVMRAASPAFIPRNHRVEEALAAAVERQDYAPFERLVAVLSRPFEDQPENAAYADPPAPSERVYQTFCGV